MDNSDYCITMAWSGYPVAPNVDRKMREMYSIILACEVKEGRIPIGIGIEIEIEKWLMSAEASETNSSITEAYAVYEEDWSPAFADKAMEFMSIIRNLSSNDLGNLAGTLEHDHMRKYGEEAKNFMATICMGRRSDYGVREKVKDSGGGDGFIMKYAVPALFGAAAKTVGGKVISDVFSGHSIDPWAKPYVDAATAGGVVLIGSAVVLMEKKPWLSKVMVKVGVLAIAFSTLLPMTLALPPAMALVFGLMVAFTLVATAAIV